MNSSSCASLRSLKSGGSLHRSMTSVSSEMSISDSDGKLSRKNTPQSLTSQPRRLSLRVSSMSEFRLSLKPSPDSNANQQTPSNGTGAASATRTPRLKGFNFPTNMAKGPTANPMLKLVEERMAAATEKLKKESTAHCQTNSTDVTPANSLAPGINDSDSPASIKKMMRKELSPEDKATQGSGCINNSSTSKQSSASSSPSTSSSPSASSSPTTHHLGGHSAGTRIKSIAHATSHTFPITSSHTSSSGKMDQMMCNKQIPHLQTQPNLQERSHKLFSLRRRSNACSQPAESCNPKITMKPHKLSSENLSKVEDILSEETGNDHLPSKNLFQSYSTYLVQARERPRQRSSFRKRQSWMQSDISDDGDDDSTRCSSNSSVQSTSLLSSTSNKIHRHFGLANARATLAGSLENLQIRPSLPNMFTNDMKNQNFSIPIKSLRVNTKTEPFPKQNDIGNSPWVTPPSTNPNSANDLRHHPNQSDRRKAKHEVAPLEKLKHHPIDHSHKIKNIPCILPDRAKHHSVANRTPMNIVQQALKERGVSSSIKSSIEMHDDFFIKHNEEHFNSYGQDVVDAVRSNDIERLKKMCSEGKNFQCCNRFGESLIHLACRRSLRETVSFLINDGGVSLRVRDDFGRTPCHDACWRAEPDLELIDMLLDREPQLLMLSDKRGHTPLDYARREHWGALIPFLSERSQKFQPVE